MNPKSKRIDRRKFLALTGASGLGLGVAACSTPPVPAVPVTPTPMDHSTTASSPANAQLDDAGVKTAVERIGIAPLQPAADR